jgi:hypothetical protein
MPTWTCLFISAVPITKKLCSLLQYHYKAVDGPLHVVFEDSKCPPGRVCVYYCSTYYKAVDGPLRVVFEESKSPLRVVFVDSGAISGSAAPRGCRN